MRTTTTERFAGLGDLAKFTAAVALLAILSDAAVGHALLWENDPYWTYWITKTFLIATVFGLGSAWLGAGVARGAVITAVHTLILTVYYWSLSPIGLPSHPEWLDLEHTWVTGLPVHFGVIYLGYLAALWLWRRRGREAEDAGTVGADAGRALLVGGGIVVVAGLLEALALGEFPGVTWFVVRVLITVPFTLAWWAVAGRDRAAAVAGAVTLTTVLVTYSHFLGPVGLPDPDLRVLAEDPPPATVHFLSYRDEFLVAMPITLVIALVGFLVASAWRSGGWVPVRLRTTAVVGTVASLLVIVALGAVTADKAEPGADRATVTSAGQAMVERGSYYEGDLVDAQADLRMTVEERNPRVTPLPPHDRVNLRASIRHPDGTRYDVRAVQPMIDDPKGRFGTWWGVGFERWHHGRSGIGTTALEATHSDIGVFALGEVRAGGDIVATGVPVHVMTMEDDMLELDVGDPGSPVPSLPDGHLRVVWDDHDGEPSNAPESARFALGTAVLLALLLLALAGVAAQKRE